MIKRASENTKSPLRPSADPLTTQEPVAEPAVKRLLEERPRRSGESFEQWIRRVGTKDLPQEESADVVTLGSPVEWRTHCERLAAATADGNELALPDTAMLSKDGAFELTVVQRGDRTLELSLRAIGFAAVELAGERLALAESRGSGDIVAIVELDEDGDGVCQLEDDPRVRQALFRPRIGVLGRS